MTCFFQLKSFYSFFALDLLISPSEICKGPLLVDLSLILIKSSVLIDSKKMIQEMNVQIKMKETQVMHQLVRELENRG